VSQRYKRLLVGVPNAVLVKHAGLCAVHACGSNICGACSRM
jgi:hypothetical protein